MLKLVDALFGCTHKHCTFPRTAAKPGTAGLTAKPAPSTYIVCLDCGKEFPYDWTRMKVMGAGEQARQAAA